MDTHSTHFLLDSGATCHVVNNKNILLNYSTLQLTRFIRCANGHRLPMLGTGSLPGSLGRAYFVPDAITNLISVS